MNEKLTPHRHLVRCNMTDALNNPNSIDFIRISEPSTSMQVVVSESRNSDWMLVGSGVFTHVCGTASIFYIWGNETFRSEACYNCRNNISEIVQCLGVTNPELIRYISPAIELNETRKVSNVYITPSGNYTYLTIRNIDQFSFQPPYVLAYDAALGEWSEEFYPPGIQADDVCPTYLCFLEFPDTMNMPWLAGLSVGPIGFSEGILVLTSTDDSYHQPISLLMPNMTNTTEDVMVQWCDQSYEVSPTSGYLFNAIFCPALMYYGEVRYISNITINSTSGPIVTGHFFSNDTTFRNIGFHSNGEWHGIGGGNLNNGVIMTVVEWKRQNCIFIGGVFLLANSTIRNIAVLFNYTTEYATQPWQGLEPGALWWFSDDSLVTSLAVYEVNATTAYLIIGGEFEIIVNGSKIFNFGIWDLYEKVFVDIEGIEQGRVSPPKSSYILLPCVEV